MCDKDVWETETWDRGPYMNRLLELSRDLGRKSKYKEVENDTDRSSYRKFEHV